MTQKSLGYVELEWNCPKCGTPNPGGQRTCTNCGAPQPEGVEFQPARRQELLTDQSKIEQARKGADIHCPYCGTRNPADATICSQCGGDLKGGEKRISGRVVGAYQAPSGVEQQVTCPNCGALNPETNKTCVRCGAGLVSAAPQTPPAATAPRQPINRTWLYVGVALAGLLVIACLAIFLLNLSRRDSLTGTVAEVHWMRSIPILALIEVKREAFIDEIPADAQVGQCQPRYHHTQDTPVEGAEEVCGTPYTRETGSGYAEVVQDCQYEVYLDYCEYTAQEWQAIDQAVLQGDDLNPSWPQVQLSQGQEQGEPQETYTVIFQTEQGQIRYAPPDEASFRRFSPGSEWMLTLNGFGDIISIEGK